MPKPSKKDLETLEILENEKNSSLSSPSDDDIIEAPKIEKPRKPRTEKQIETTQKMRERLKKAQEERKLKKQMEDEQKRRQLEEKIVKKAIAIKKKQIKKESVLDSISDDETPIEEIKKIVKNPVRQAPKQDKDLYKQPPAPPTPAAPEPKRIKYIFI